MKLQLNVYGRLVLIGMISAYKELKQNELTMRDNVAFDSLLKSLSFNEDEMIKYDIKNEENRSKWNEDGLNPVDVKVHPLAMTALTDVMIHKMESKGIDPGSMAIIRLVMKNAIDSDERETLEKETLERLEKKNAEVEELYKEFGLLEEKQEKE